MDKNFSIDPYKGAKIINKVDKELLVINKSKISNDLKSYIEIHSKKDYWIGALSLFITILATVITATFDNMGFSKHVWKAIFVILGGATFIWFVVSLLKLKKMKGLDEFITEVFYEEEPIKISTNTPPKVVKTYPANNSTIPVSPNGEVIEFTVEYDQRMGYGVSWCQSNLPFPGDGEELHPYWDETGRKCSLKMKVVPNMDYGIQFNIAEVYEGFRSLLGVPAEPYSLRFSTTEKTV